MVQALRGSLTRGGLQAGGLAPGMGNGKLPSTPSVPWTPAELATAVWLDAADAATITLNGSSVSQWNDKSGNGVHVAQPTANQQPAYTASGLNSKGLLTFDGSNDNLFNQYYPGAGASRNTLTTIIAVFKYITGGSSEDIAIALGRVGAIQEVRGLYRAANGTTQGYVGWGAELLSSSLSCDIGGDHHLWSVVQSSITAPQISLWRDGSIDSGSPRSLSGNLKSTVDYGVRIGNINAAEGSGYNYSTNMSMAEVLIFDSALSTGNRQKCEGYLAHKWGLAASLPSDHPYKAAAPTV